MKEVLACLALKILIIYHNMKRLLTCVDMGKGLQLCRGPPIVAV